MLYPASASALLVEEFRVSTNHSQQVIR